MSGDCHISIELAGAALPSSVSLLPSDIASRAIKIIEECVINQSGTGGFGTLSFSNLLGHVLSAQAIPDDGVGYRKGHRIFL